MRAIAALALNGFRESRRNRVSVVVVAFTLGLLLVSSLVTEVTIYTMQRVLTDFGFGLMSLTLVLLSVFLSCGTLTREIDRKTIFLIVSKPVSRATFLVGRFAGTMLTLAVLLAGMVAVFFVQERLYGLPILPGQLQAAVLMWFELLVICGVGFLMASFSSQLVSAAVTVGVYFAGHLAPDVYQLSERFDGALKWLARGAYYVLPNLSRLSLRSEAAHELVVPTQTLLGSMGYALAYTAATLALAVIVFERRDFK